MNMLRRRAARSLIAVAIGAIVVGVPAASGAYPCYTPRLHTSGINLPGQWDVPPIGWEGQERCIHISPQSIIDRIIPR